MNRLLWGLALCVGLVGVGACASNPPVYRIEPIEDAEKAPTLRGFPDFVMVSDTQYALPFTDYDMRYRVGKQIVDIPPELSTYVSRAFYRNAESHFAVPLAFEGLVEAEIAKKRQFGLFGGDMAEFSCADETAQIFSMLEQHAALPFIVTIGNHDATFHGSFDTDGISRSGAGAWDLYSYALWGSVCEHVGGRLTKAGFIRQLVHYYETAWQLDIHGALGLQASQQLPRGVPLEGAASTKNGWDVTFEIELSPADDAESHRESHFYQRWTRAAGPAGPGIAVTSLDTTDFGTRPVLCDPIGRLVQVGLGGSISEKQVSWLEHLPKPYPGTAHIALAHYLPFQNVAGIQDCDSTLGTHCLGKRLADALGDPVYVYAHVHQPFELDEIEKPACVVRRCWRGGCKDEASTKPECEHLRVNPLVRLPSLIDNKQYAVFADGRFRGVDLRGTAGLVGRKPFATPATPEPQTCSQRVYEFLELERNIACFRTRNDKDAVCPSIESLLTRAGALASELCAGEPKAWKANNDALWKVFSAPPKAAARAEGACYGWTPSSPEWRCILRGLSYQALEKAGLDAAQVHELGTSLLVAAEPKRADPEPLFR